MEVVIPQSLLGHNTKYATGDNLCYQGQSYKVVDTFQSNGETKYSCKQIDVICDVPSEPSHPVITFAKMFCQSGAEYLHLKGEPHVMIGDQKKLNNYNALKDTFLQRMKNSYAEPFSTKTMSNAKLQESIEVVPSDSMSLLQLLAFNVIQLVVRKMNASKCSYSVALKEIGILHHSSMMYDVLKNASRSADFAGFFDSTLTAEERQLIAALPDAQSTPFWILVPAIGSHKPVLNPVFESAYSYQL